MSQRNSLLILVACTLTLHAASEVSIKGTITGEGATLAGVAISLVNQPAMKTVSGNDGAFELTGNLTTTIARKGESLQGIDGICISRGALTFRTGVPIDNGAVTLFSADGREAASIPLSHGDAATQRVALPSLAPGFYIMTIIANDVSVTRNLLMSGNEAYVSTVKPSTTTAGSDAASFAGLAAMPVDQLLCVKAGFKEKKVPVASYKLDNVAIIMEKDGNVTVAKEAGCTSPLPTTSYAGYPANGRFPDPFKMKDGTRMSRKDQWCEQRAYLSSLLQATSLGEKPPKPDKVTATFSGDRLTINCTVGSTTKSFSVTISGVPSGNGPFPALIGLGGAFQMGAPTGVAKISYSHGTIAAQGGTSSRGSGLFYDLYGKNHSAGAMMAWAWGLSRILDGLELCPETKINPLRCAITGCSRDGKGAMVCGVFDERLALTLPMEGGSGGISSWRIAKVENSNKSAHPDGCQTASQIIGENVWMSPAFNQFANGDIAKLPTDAHTLAAICAPRGIYFVEGSQNSWNCNVCCWTAASAAQMVYEALGVKSNIGIVQTDHGHCQLTGAKEKEAWNAFIKRFLLDDANTATDYFSNDGSFDKLIDFPKWIDWTRPVLE